MSHAATFDDDVFRAFRNSGMSEEHAAAVAKAIPSRAEVATKADLADLRAAIPERENFAAKADVAVLQTKMETVEAAIIRIDETIVRINENIARINETIIRMDKKIDAIDARLSGRIDVLEEKVNGLQAQIRLFVIPLHLLTLTALFALLSKGFLW